MKKYFPGDLSLPIPFDRLRLNMCEPRFNDGKLGSDKKTIEENKNKND